MSELLDGVKVGQIWERRSDGARVEIVKCYRGDGDLNYRRVGENRTRPIYAYNLRKRYTLIEGATS